MPMDTVTHVPAGIEASLLLRKPCLNLLGVGNGKETGLGAEKGQTQVGPCDTELCSLKRVNLDTPQPHPSF